VQSFSVACHSSPILKTAFNSSGSLVISKHQSKRRVLNSSVSHVRRELDEWSDSNITGNSQCSLHLPENVTGLWHRYLLAISKAFCGLKYARQSQWLSKVNFPGLKVPSQQMHKHCINCPVIPAKSKLHHWENTMPTD
jgi:hypothetical protein